MLVPAIILAHDRNISWSELLISLCDTGRNELDQKSVAGQIFR